MPQVRTNGTITNAGAQYIAQKTKDIEPVVISYFLLANLPGVDETTEADQAMTLADVPDGNIVGSNYPMYSIGYADDTHVTYGLHLDAHQGDFDFNWVGMVTDNGVLFAFVNIPLVKKRKGIGQVINRHLLLSYSAARVLNPAAIPAETWQFDYTDILGSLVISLTGENWIHLGESKQYIINDFDDMGVYTAGTDTGTAKLNGRVITLDMPDNESTGTAHLLVSRNGFTRDVPIEVREQAIGRPRMLTPVDGATDVVAKATLSCTAFETFPAGVDNHRATDWRLTLADGTVVWESLGDTANKTSIMLPEHVLTESTDYQVQVRFLGNNIAESEWSEPVSFRSADVFYRLGSNIGGEVIVGQLNGYWVLVAPPSKRPKIAFKLSSSGNRQAYQPVTTFNFIDPVSGKVRTNYWLGLASGFQAMQYCHDNGYFLPNIQELKFVIDNRSYLRPHESGSNSLDDILSAGESIWSSTDIHDTQTAIYRSSHGDVIGNNLAVANRIIPIRFVAV